MIAVAVVIEPVIDIVEIGIGFPMRWRIVVHLAVGHGPVDLLRRPHDNRNHHSYLVACIGVGNRRASS